MWAVADDSHIKSWATASDEEWQQRIAAIADLRVASVEDASHMLHHDQPEQVAALIEGFLSG